MPARRGSGRHGEWAYRPSVRTIPRKVIDVKHAMRWPSNRSALMLALLLGGVGAAISGCQENTEEKPSTSSTPTAESKKVKIAYIGLTCEAAMFVAQEKGFFREEGLDVEFVRLTGTACATGLALAASTPITR